MVEKGILGARTEKKRKTFRDYKYDLARLM